MSELSDVIGGNTITATFTNEVKERSVMRYADAAARDTSIPAPVAGSLAWLQDVDQITVYDGAVWVTVALEVGARMLLQDGTETVPSNSFASDPDAGTFLFAPNQLGFAGNGTVFGRWGITNFYLEASVDDVRFRGINAFQTTGSTANLFCDTTGTLGQMRRVTSARRFKTNIQDASHLADLVLEPVTCTH